MRSATALLAAAALAAGCAHGPVAPASEVAVEEVRRGIARCPASLDDAALDDLATYEACPLPARVAELVRNDEADDELELPDLALLQRNAFRVPRAAFEAQLARFVDPRGVLAGWIELDATRDVLRPDPLLSPGVEIAFSRARAWTPGCSGEACAGQLLPPLRPDRPYRPARRAELLAARSPRRPLAGLRVAVDPGHLGGAYAAFEERQVTWRPEPAARPIVLREGDLALRTALELRAKLTARGAEVLLTREAPGIPPAPLHTLRPYAERLLRRIALEPGYRALEAQLAPAERRRLHAALALFAVKKQSRFESLRERARLANRRGADLLLSIHYNASRSPTGARGSGEVVAMVRGFHDAIRLYNPYYRYRALEEAFAVDDFDAAVHLGVGCVRAMSSRLRIPVAREPRYEDHLAVRDGQGQPVGVDAWDGALLRYLDLPGILTEGPSTNEGEEMRRLDAALRTPLGTPGTRTDEYASALASCVEGWARRWIGSERNPFGSELPTQPDPTP